jgi:outer membrane murein-binding lipoprotein Lpp
MRLRGVAVLGFAAVLVAGVILSGCNDIQDSGEVSDGANTSASTSQTEKEQEAVRLAVKAYTKLKTEGADLSNGPCISDDLMDDWVADVAHYPREDVDNLPENQCPSYGKTASHFVELDEYGEVIRVE